MNDIVFPQGFLWGTSTSAYQTEGGNDHADWWRWERAGRTAERCGAAADSWNRWEEDLDLAASLGMKIHRISAEWSRIEPEPGCFDAAAIDRYVGMLRGIHARGMQSMLVLWHFTNPAWLAERRPAWSDQRSPAAFERFVRHVVPRLAPHVDWWATLNEANTAVDHGWMKGDWPPGRTNDRLGALRAFEFLAQGHRRAAAVIRELAGPGARIGITHVVPWAHPARGARFTGPHQRFSMWQSTHLFLDKVAPSCDWIGVQYYYDLPVTTFAVRDADGEPPRTDLGWRISPQGIHAAVMAVWSRYRVPILVTENGLADAADAQRTRFILDHLAWVARAIADGADVRGYLHWSLIDNFEWVYGFAPRFGLAGVDYKTFARTPRRSASVYAEMARTNVLPMQRHASLVYADGTPSLAPAPEQHLHQ